MKSITKTLFEAEALSAKTSALGERLAAHLLRRTTYQYDIARIREFAVLTPGQALDQLLAAAPAPEIPEPIDANGTGQPWINSGPPPTTGGGSLYRSVAAWWLENARQDPTINHRMMFFLHTAFTAAAVKSTAAAPRFFDHLSLLRFMALGNFKSLAFKMTFDVQMLNYLDNRVNTAADPNENYAREFLELFTIGKGPQIGPDNYTHYTEYDVQQAARVLTGTVPGGSRGGQIDEETGIPRGYYAYGRHDRGDKTFSSAFGSAVITGSANRNDMERELQDFIDMVYDQVETARHLCRRLYRFFVDDEIDDRVEQEVIIPLADYCYAEDYELAPTLRKLLSSRHFYGEDAMGADNKTTIGALMKSPLELVLPPLHALQIPFPTAESDPSRLYRKILGRSLVDGMFGGMNLSLFLPQTVAGYPAYHQAPLYSKTWFDTTAIIDRYFLPVALIENKERVYNTSFGARVNMPRFLRRSGHFADPSDANEVVTTLLTLCLPEVVSPDRFDYFMNVFLDGLSIINWRFEWNNYLDTGDDSDVKIPLDNLLKAIMYSQEYQLF